MARDLVPVPPLPAYEHLGPKMRALATDRERAFVWIYLNNGGEGADAARRAGYSSASKQGPLTQAYRMIQRQDILDAMHECTWKVLGKLAPKAAQVLALLLDSENEKIQLKAVDMIFARTGFIAKTGMVVEEKRLSSEQLVAEIRKAAITLGVDAEKLLGDAAVNEPKAIAPPIPFNRKGAIDAEVIASEDDIDW